MHSLTAILDELDTFSIETKRPITLPLLRDLLELEPNE
jgi:DnaA family protein